MSLAGLKSEGGQHMKTDKRAIAVFISVVILFAGLPIMITRALPETPKFEIFSDGKTVNKATVAIDKKLRLTAADNIPGNFQWQIYIPQNTWANIWGENSQSIDVSYAMIANLLDKNSVDIRCKITDGKDEFLSKKVTLSADNKLISNSSINSASAPSVNIQGAEAGTEVEDDPVLTTHLITVNYFYENGMQAGTSFTAQVADGSDYKNTVKSPVVVGYKPDTEIVELDYKNVTQDFKIDVVYRPAEVKFEVRHYHQNTADDKYTLFDTDVITDRVTGSMVGSDIAKKYDGFIMLPFDQSTAIAADGSTVINIYYDRLYYLMLFNLDGGYGVEPIYARCGAPVSVDSPTKAGYKFIKWSPAVPSSMPAENTRYTAQWTPDGSVPYTVVVWYENADDSGYTSVASTIKSAQVGTEVLSGTYSTQSVNDFGEFKGRDNTHFTYNKDKAETVTVSGDGSTILNVYFSRKIYTLTFDLNGKYDSNSVAVNKPDNYKYPQLKIGDKEYTGEYTLTAKYEANISELWPTAGDFIQNLQYRKNNKSPYTEYQFQKWNGNLVSKRLTLTSDLIDAKTFTAQWNTNLTAYYLHYMFETPDGTGTVYTYNKKTYYVKESAEYSQIANTDNGDWSAKAITGFTSFFVDKDDEGGKSDGYVDIYLYYSRNKYSLILNNMGSEENLGLRYFEADLSADGNDQRVTAPSYPKGKEPGAYEFKGWYTSPTFSDDTHFDFTKAKMPPNNLVIYANWVPVIHTVTTRLTEFDAEIIDTWTVPHDTVITKSPPPPINGNYEFVGWFYNDGGIEKAFDFSMQIQKNMDLYAKWRYNKLMPYTVHYVTYVNGEAVKIADDFEGIALAGTTKTVSAKTDNELYGYYRKGYFPQISSHNLSISIDGSNEFTFIYVLKEKVNYTVKFLEAETDKVLYEDRIGSTDNAVITEEYERITGYRPDAFQKRLVLSADEQQNVLIFYYTEDSAHAPVQITHYIELPSGGYTVYQDVTDLDGVIGNTYTAEILTIPGFTFDKSVAGTLTKGKLTENGLHLRLYYELNSYPYEFRFLEMGTNNVLAAPISGNAKHKSQITENAKTIDGYTVNGEAQHTITIEIEDNKTAVKNVKTFYYVKAVNAVADLIISKSGAENIDENQSFVFRITGKGADNSQIDIKAVIHGNGSVTIKDLPFGDYTVTEETAWSWRYTPKNSPLKNVTLNSEGAQVEFFNIRTADKWLNGSWWCDNRWVNGSAKAPESH